MWWRNIWMVPYTLYRHCAIFKCTLRQQTCLFVLESSARCGWSLATTTLIYCDNKLLASNDFEPSWLKPELELKDFQLGSARDLFHFSSELKIQCKTSWNFNSRLNNYFLLFSITKLTKLCIWIKLFTFKNTHVGARTINAYLATLVTKALSLQRAMIL